MANRNHAGHAGRRVHRRHYGVWIMFVVLVIAVLAVAAGATFYAQAKQVKAHEERAMSLVGTLSWQNARSAKRIETQLPSIQRETRAANDIAHNTLWGAMTHLPMVGNDVATVQGMTAAVDCIAHSSMPQFVQAIDTLTSSRLTSSQGGLNLQPLLDSQRQVTSANTSLQRAMRQFDALPDPRLSMVRSAYRAARQQLDTVADTANSLSNALNVLPDFLGSGQTRTYAVMAMTTSEARSSGGLIGSVGVMTTDNGKISVDDFRPNTEYIPYGSGDPTSDEWRVFNTWGPLHMSFDIRDLAVYPDTSRTAEGMKAIWQRTPWGKSTELDGVLLLDPVFLQQLIAINGNVTLSNGQVLTGTNTAQFLLNTVYQKYSPTEQDLYFQQVAEQSIANMFSNVNLTKLTAIGKVMGTMAQQRHFSMYSFDTGIERRLGNAGFTAQTPHDQTHPSVGVYVTEQNPSKMDWYIHRTSTITRSSCNADGSQTYHVRYTMTNTLTAAAGASLSNYIIGEANGLRTYGLEKTLIYAPAGGSISNLRTTGDVYDSRRETMNGTSIQASLAKLAPGASVTYDFDVSTSTKSVADMTLDQTPVGWSGTTTTTDMSACAIATGK